MKDIPKEPITIVVPVKNRATLVLRTLNSIKAQTWRPLKLIVVDNGSTDGTSESVQNWIEKNKEEEFEVILENEPSPGAARARNKGLEATDTRLIMFFDSDDTMNPLHVETIMRRFHAGDNPDLVFFRVHYHGINDSDKITCRPSGDNMIAHICHGLLRTQGYACETALARRAGAWDEDLPVWNDLEFGSRILMEARKRVYIPDVNVEVFAQVESITGTEFSSRKGQWEKALDKMALNFEKSRHKDREKWLRVLAYKRTILAAMYWREKNHEVANDLFDKALDDPSLNSLQRIYLKLAFNYTGLGGRGTAVLVNLIF